MSITKNSIRRHLSVLLPVLLLLVIQAGKVEGGEKTAVNKNIRILILSKHLREVREGKTPSMIMDFPRGTYAESSSGKIPLKKLIVSYRDGAFVFTNGQAVLHGSRIIITCETPGSFFTFDAGDNTRRYPLPLEISAAGNSADFIITEDTRQYAIDSASAELGIINDSSTEALYALAHAIFARSLSVKEGSKHTCAHFCDLTCCQTYKGFTDLKFDDPDTISPECGNRLFFGSSGGGIILTGKVFSTDSPDAEKPCRDIIFSENLTLSMKLYPSWKVSIRTEELNSILYPAIKKKAKEVIYSPLSQTMTLDTYEGLYRIAPETFRLIINRKKGWSFIKSNNYTVSSENGLFTFSGSGLGHCAGMSIEGAVQLSRKGYSRYEILEHYYPWLKYNIPEKKEPSFYSKYITFDLENGKVCSSSSECVFLDRRIPFGSICKLVTTLYLAMERKDIFYNYRYVCRGQSGDGDLPDKCWDRNGHGDMDLNKAIYNSCNLYFASLSDELDMKKYLRWVREFAEITGIEVDLPEIKSRKEFAALLAGIDFRLTINIKSLVRLALLLSDHNCNDERLAAFRKKINPDELFLIRDALCKTMSKGTGSHEPPAINDPGTDGYQRAFLWGKTGTVISGTNNHYGYGIFIGGNRKTGIVLLQRKGTGAAAAKKSAEILLENRLY